MALGVNGALAQTSPPTPGAITAAQPCPEPRQVRAPDLYGQWQVSFSKPPRGLPAQATLQLERHAEFSESLAGQVKRDLSAAPGGQVAGHSPRAQLAGDIEAGQLMLDESSNGINLTASWDGQIVPGSCGKRIEGLWKDLSSAAPPDTPDVPFTLTRITGW